MASLRVGTININPKVGAVYSNVALMKKGREQLLSLYNDIDVITYFELSICGYPPEDMIQWPSFVEAQLDALKGFVEVTVDDDIVYLVGAAIEHKGNIYNSVVVISKGKIHGIVPKEKLPTYGVFYDGRTFTPGMQTFEKWQSVYGNMFPYDIYFGDMTFMLGGVCRIGTEVCEDIWVPDGPMPRRSYNGAEVIFNLSASPWRPGVHNTRRRMLASRSADNCVGVVYTNQVGGNDSLVFDGGSYAYEVGKEIATTGRWHEGVNVIDINLDNIRRERNANTTWRNNRQAHTSVDNVVQIPLTGNVGRKINYGIKTEATLTAAKGFVGIIGRDSHAPDEIDEMREAILLGMQDYYTKAAPFKAEVISLSGGRDSVLVLLYAYENAKRMGKDPAKQIYCYSMPTRFNSDDTKNIARDVCEALGVNFVERSIQAVFESEIKEQEEMAGEPLSRLAKQNLQARLRACRVRTIANTKSALLWQTGSMSEKATGYTTLGGDMEGDYSPLTNVPKTVEELLLFRELELAKDNPALEKVIRKLLEETVASAELEAGQDDQSELAPFPVIDTCYKMFFGEKLGYKDILEQVEARIGSEQLMAVDPNYQKKLEGWVVKCITRFMQSVYKWVQMCQGIHLIDIDLDRERALQIPTVQSLEWLRM